MSEDPLSPDTGIIKEVLTVEGTTIKDLLINPISYNIIEITIKLLNTVRELIPAGVNEDRKIKTLLTVLNTDHGKAVLEHLLEHCSYTYREIELKLGIPKGTISYITTKLIFMGLVESRTVVIPFNPKTPGTRPIVWVLVGAPPKASVDCIYRHYGLERSEGEEGARSEYREPEVLYNLSEAGQEQAEIWINYFTREDRLHLIPKRRELKRNISLDAPDIKMEEREAIVRHIMTKVKELREASK